MLTEDQLSQIWVATFNIKGLAWALDSFSEKYEPESTEIGHIHTVLSFILPEIEKITDVFSLCYFLFSIF